MREAAPGQEDRGGGGGAVAAGPSALPLSLKVKNTFIDVKGSFVAADGEEEDEPLFATPDTMRKRQVSEPAMSFQRQLSGSARSPWRGATTDDWMRGPGGGFFSDKPALVEEDPDGDELDEEPDIEADPCKLIARGFGRQETEVVWPSWGLPDARGNRQGDLPQAAVDPMRVPQMLAEHPLLAPNLAQHLMLYRVPDLGSSLPGLLDSPTLPVGVPLPNGVGMAQGVWPEVPLQQATEAGNFNKLPAAARAAAASAPAPAAPTPCAPAISSAAAPPADWAGTTTVMMRNLPNKYTQQMLLEELNQSGFLGTFDFMYLPIDPETNANRGYAFINFVDPGYAWMLKMTYEGRKMKCFNSDKVVSVAAAALQGFEANHAHYSTSRVNRGDPAARPLFLRESSLHASLKPESAGRRRGGRRSSGSLIDLAAKKQQQPQLLQQPPRPRTGQQPQQQPQQQQPPGPAPRPPPAGDKAVSNLQRQLQAITAGAGAATTAAAPQQTPARSGTTNGEDQKFTARFCPFCGGQVQPQFKFCQFCGASLTIGGKSV